MKKEVKQHIVYGLIIVSIVVGIMFYQNKVTIETRQMLSQQIVQLMQQLQETKGELGGDIQQLEEKDVSLEENIQELLASLAEKETEIKALTGQLEQLRVQSEQQVAELEQTITNLQLQYQDFSDVIDDVIPAVVSVQTDAGLGSGFIVDRDGYIVTNYHVVDKATAAAVLTSDGEVHAVRIVGFDSRVDIAVLKIEGRFSRLRFGNSNMVRVGEKMIAVGNPGGLDFTVTQGIVSAVNRLDAKGNKYIQIDVPINPGNSGGPLVNAAGEVVGVNSLKIAGFEGVGFALESNFVDDIVDDIIEGDTS